MDYAASLDPGELRKMAAAKLDFQAARARFYQSHYDLEAGIIALLDTAERRTFQTFLAESHANWCELVVNAVAERLKVVGFRFGSKDDSDAAWAIWQANSLDADASLVLKDALVQGSAFMLVQPDDDNPSGVCISGESAMQATVLYEPGSRRKRIAGYKRFPVDPWVNMEMSEFAEGSLLTATGSQVEVLILPDEIYTWLPGSSQPSVEPNPAGFVGLIEIVPQPRTLGPGRSELHSAVSIQDRIHTTIFNRLVATDYGAFRQIWATGIKIARQVIKDDDTATGGTVTSRVVARPFDVGANRLLANEAPDGKFGSFPESTLAGYLSSVTQDVQQLAAITQTPPHYLLGQMVNLAADAIKAAETGLVSKCGERSRYAGESFEEVMRCAFTLTGSAAAADTSAEVVWADMETRSEGQRVDALVKMATLGVPREILWQKWGATPQEIDEWNELLAASASETVEIQPALPRGVKAAPADTAPPQPDALAVNPSAPPAPAPAQ
ncbi:MAG TPA: phage portal protein [Trebonia sp.]|nr:phage portal protein [Trebonia sp.]